MWDLVDYHQIQWQSHASKGNGASTTSIWPRKTCQEALIDTPPQEVQAVVTRLTAPIPQTEKEIAQQLKQQVTEMKNQSIRKNQLQAKLDQVKSQYAAMLQGMQDIQTKLNEGQQKLKAAVNQTPKPEELNHEAATAEPIPMAVESFVTSLGISLTEEQRSQLHGLLKRPNTEGEDPTKRRKTEATAAPHAGQLCG